MSPLILAILVAATQKCHNVVVTTRTEELFKVVVSYLGEELQYLASAAELEEQRHGNIVSQSLT